MKKIVFYIAILITGSLQFAWAQTSATASFTASATIIQPIGITTTAHMNFAGIDAGQGGEIILTPENIRISSGGVILAGEENLSAATFTVTGQPGYAYSISIPRERYTLTNGTEEMVLENFTSSLTSVGRLAENDQIIRVGATLRVSPGQTPGFYTTPAPMDVTVNYN